MKQSSSNLINYYDKRAQEYEEIYHRSDKSRKKELAKISSVVKKLFKGKDTVEIACGTGYWTTIVSKTAKSTTAIDTSKAMIKEAQTKQYLSPTHFQIANAYKLPFKKNSFNAGLAMFWFSHIPKNKSKSFLEEFHRVLNKNSIVFIGDNIFNKDSGGPIKRKVGDKNTYKLRTLNSGEQFLIIKNFFPQKKLIKIFSRFDNNFSDQNVFFGKYYWFIYYKLNSK